MKVALTGATGFIGSHVLSELQGHGHQVTALVRDASKAEILANRGATPTVVDLYDRGAVVAVLRVPVTPRAPTWIPRSPTRRSRRSPPPASPTCKSAVCGSTETTPRSPSSHQSMRLRSWRGRSRSSGECSPPRTCAES
jgi:hypothetical protein